MKDLFFVRLRKQIWENIVSYIIISLLYYWVIFIIIYNDPIIYIHVYIHNVYGYGPCIFWSFALKNKILMGI